MGLSINPENMVESSVVPVEMNLEVTNARFHLFDYTKKDGTVVATTPALRIKAKSDEGTEYEMEYSVGDIKKYQPSEDNENPAAEGKFIIAISGSEALSKSSNFYQLMQAFINAGFPKNKLGEDISVIEGTHGFWIGQEEPKRAGLNTAPVAEGARARVLSVPSKIDRLPWEKKAASGKTAAAKTVAKAAAPAGDVMKETVDFVKKQIEAADGGTVQRSALAGSVYTKLAKNANKNAIATALFTPEFEAALKEAGMVLDGNDISMAE